MIVVAGEALIDLLIGLDGSVSAELGGGPFNVARTIGRLGVDVALLASISDDRFGSMLLDQLTTDGVGTSLITRTDAPTTLAAAELDHTGAASYRFYFAGTSAPSVEFVPDFARDARAVHVGTLGLVLEPMATTIERFVNSLAGDVLVMLDPNCRAKAIGDRLQYVDRITRISSRAHVIKISTEDSEYLAPELSPAALAEQMIAAGVRAVLITAGGTDTVVVTRNGNRSVAIPAVSVADTVGAGDSFCGGFLTAWLQSGNSIDDLCDPDLVASATACANEVAASTCTRVGADPPSRSQLRAGWGAR